MLEALSDRARALFTSGADRGRIVRVQDRVGLKAAGLLCAAMLLGGGLAACGPSGESVKTSRILVSDAASETVQLLLVSGSTGADGGFNFDGYGDGAMRVSIPLGWRVEVACKNSAANFSHSCAIVDDRPLSAYGAPLAFPGASTPDPREGLGPGVSKSFSFVAARVGTYRIACLVSGHEIDGMWDWLNVTRGGLPKVRT